VLAKSKLSKTFLKRLRKIAQNSILHFVFRISELSEIYVNERPKTG